MTEKKYLGFDIGEQHTGVAQSFGTLAQPLTTIETGSYSKLVDKIISLSQEINADGIILGLPSRGPIRELVQKLEQDLKNRHLDVFFIDETSSTKQTQKAMIAGGISAVKRQRREHQMVAARLLQEYLDLLD